ncbi:Scr1 family TA system antitoxin-like transcriptional regulator [Streptomyces sp. NPDC048717]|uniref:Scr1 family TA system antitoxin-like transcriptional regulator n=1 Tax=Streptomyces sp. NPDC048717 TaxID=3154928 RepID=UPI003427AE92
MSNNLEHHDETGTTEDSHAHLRVPRPSRIHNWLTGGSEHYPADRDFALRLVAAAPWIEQSALINQRHHTKGLIALAQMGIKQFLDIGCGYPAAMGRKRGRGHVPPLTYDAARTVHPHARVVYVDNDPNARGHMDATTKSGARTALADARDIPGLLTSRPVIDTLTFTQPIGVILHDLLPWVSDDEATTLVQSLHELLPAGSAVSITHTTPDHDPDATAAIVALYATIGVDYRPRTLDQIRDLLGPWELTARGIAPIGLWRQGEDPQIPKKLRTGWRLPPSDSHAYAAVTAPKKNGPAPLTVEAVLAREPGPRAPVPLLLGSYLRGLREVMGVTREELAGKIDSTALAIEASEAGSGNLRDYDCAHVCRGLGLDDWPTGQFTDGPFSPAPRHRERQSFLDQAAGHTDRAAAVLRASTHVRTFAFDRIPQPFRTNAYDSCFPADTEPSPLPSIPAPLAKDPGRTWELVIDEGVLNRCGGHPKQMADQLDHLLDLAALPHITIRVLPAGAPLATPLRTVTEYTLLGGTLWRDEPGVYSGLQKGTTLKEALDQAVTHAEPEDTSRALITHARDLHRQAAIELGRAEGDPEECPGQEALDIADRR